MSKGCGRYTDGKTSSATVVFLRLYKQGIGIFEDKDCARPIDRWTYQDIKVNHDWTDGAGGSFEHKTKYGATLSIDNKALFTRMGTMLEEADRATYLISTRITTLLALAVVALAVVFYGFPLLSKSSEQLAYVVPDSVENRIGKVAVEALDGEFRPCNDEISKKYLRTIIDRLLASHDDKTIKPDIHIYRTSMVNAFALPGQNMAVLTGFLEGAESEEEIAGVLAHELGHISNRDPLKYIIQAQGLNVVSSLSSSASAYGGVAQMAVTLSELSYSREKEEAADLFAYNLLKKSGYSTNGLIAFLTHAEEKSPKMLKPLQENLSFLSTHPKTQERIGRLKMDDAVKITYKPSLTPEQLKRLRNACPARSLKQKNKK
ncbi:MAG TPA: M48 family metallopeptidase [Alphaproteobacteria bacterium]|nr:M48 family metallopeptidase [Alphaproteobacteria bacterium]HNS43985.1 M48 family metallopeptidase [Alphaproteobacteria bacterium]